MPVPYTFGSATSAIPLSQLDSNFNTTITLGNTAIQLGNTVTTLNNMTFANVTISSVSTPITVAQGGTGTSTAFTSGSVVFAGASGVYSQNNAQLFWDNTNARLGIGTTSPAYKLDVAATTAVVQMDSSSGAAGAAGTRYKASNRTWVSGVNLTDGTGAYTVYDVTASTERMRIDSSGNLLVGLTAIGTQIRLSVQGADTTSGNYTAFFQNPSATLFFVRNDGVISTGVGSLSPYNLTTSNAANLYVDSGGTLYRSTSSLKYKTDVQNATHGLSDVLKLRSVTYKGKNDGDKVFGGLIAEEVHEAGLTEFVQYAEDGTPDALHYGNMVSLCVKAIQELKAEVDSLKSQLAAKG